MRATRIALRLLGVAASAWLAWSGPWRLALVVTGLVLEAEALWIAVRRHDRDLEAAAGRVAALERRLAEAEARARVRQAFERLGSPPNRPTGGPGGRHGQSSGRGL